MDSLDRLIEKVEQAPEYARGCVLDKDRTPISVIWVVEFDKKELLGYLREIAEEVKDMIHLPSEWIVGCDEGGGFILPESKDNVTHVTVDTILGEFYKEATEAQYTTDGLQRIVRKYADRLQMREA